MSVDGLTLLGTKDAVVGADELEPIANGAHRTCIDGNRPVAYPKLSEGGVVICGLLVMRGMPEQLYVCANLDEMKIAYDSYYSGRWSQINWYVGYNPQFLTVIV